MNDIHSSASDDPDGGFLIDWMPSEKWTPLDVDCYYGLQADARHSALVATFEHLLVHGATSVELHKVEQQLSRRASAIARRVARHSATAQPSGAIKRSGANVRAPRARRDAGQARERSAGGDADPDPPHSGPIAGEQPQLIDLRLFTSPPAALERAADALGRLIARQVLRELDISRKVETRTRRRRRAPR